VGQQSCQFQIKVKKTGEIASIHSFTKAPQYTQHTTVLICGLAPRFDEIVAAGAPGAVAKYYYTSSVSFEPQKKKNAEGVYRRCSAKMDKVRDSIDDVLY
jgi:hypothetical protein